MRFALFYRVFEPVDAWSALDERLAILGEVQR